jgi:molybdopterin converting factor small subunit
MVATKSIQIQYYALLREQRGTSSEAYSTSALNLAGLYNELKEKYQFSLPINLLQVVANDRFVSWDDTINEGDLIVFIPPVAGG